MKTLIAAGLVSGLLVSQAASAQTTGQASPATQVQPVAPVADALAGKQAGSFMIRIRAIGVLPENLSSSVSAISGNVHVTNTPAPELDLSYFITDHIAAEVIAASTRHDVSASRTVLGKVDVGSVYVLPPTLTL